MLLKIDGWEISVSLAHGTPIITNKYPGRQELLLCFSPVLKHGGSRFLSFPWLKGREKGREGRREGRREKEKKEGRKRDGGREGGEKGRKEEGMEGKEPFTELRAHWLAALLDSEPKGSSGAPASLRRFQVCALASRF